MLNTMKIALIDLRACECISIDCQRFYFFGKILFQSAKFIVFLLP